MSVRVRFAPSPTGHLHVGGARTAIFNWLFAKHHGGALIIRVEDTDQARSTAESEQMVLSDLRWLGLDWNEGPDTGGPHAPYRQSERFTIYRDMAARLLESGHAYRCFCSEEELERKREAAESEGRPPHYDLTCYRLPAGESGSKLGAGLPFVTRFHVPKGDESSASLTGDVTIHDRIRGEVTWRAESLGDFIVLRSDGMPTYNFCVVVDDHQMEITHVIRAEEHLTNTHRQVLIYRALAWETPEFAHVSLILGSDRSKLSKRHGATSVAAYAEEGFLPEAMVNYLTLLGWSPPDGQEIFSRDDAVRQFSLDRVNAAPAVFDRQKLEWMNGQYIQITDSSHLAAHVAPLLLQNGHVTALGEEVSAWLIDAVDLLKTAVLRIPEFVDALGFVFRFDAGAAASEAEVAEVLRTQEAASLLDSLEAAMTSSPPESPTAYQAMAEELKRASGAKGKKLFMPIRLALTGLQHGPELARAVPLIVRASKMSSFSGVVPPRERIRRLRAALQTAAE